MAGSPTYEELTKKVEVLEESTKIYRSLVEKSTDLFYRTDRDGRIVFISPSVYHLSGYTVEEALGMQMAREIYLHPEERQAFLDLIHKKGRAVNFEARLKRKDGSVWWASTNAHYYRNREGKIEGIEGITRDISSLKEAEKALRQAEEKFRLSFHTSPDAINLNRVSDGLYIEINKGFTDLTGYTREDVTGRSSLEINIWKNPEDRARLVSELRENGFVKNFEARFVKKSGKTGTGLMSARILRINDENVILSITREITGLLEARKELKESRDRLKLITDNMVDVISQTDAQANLIYSSPSLKRVFGYEEKDILDRPSVELIHPDDIPAVLKKVAQARQKGSESLIIEYRYRHSDGHYLWVESAVRLLYEKNGQSAGAIFVSRDITQKKAYESQLRQSQKMEAIGNLAGGIAHDFNNVLSGILGYSQLALNNITNPDKLKNHIDQIQKGARRASELVKQILTFSRKDTYTKQPVQIGHEVNEALKLLRASIPATIDIQTDISSAGLILADVTKIHQIVMNLCTNAYHAMLKTGGTLTVSLQEIELDTFQSAGYHKIPSGRYAKLTVKDTGHGMDKKTLAKAFDPYYTTKKPGQGTGLGLAVVHAIVQEHNAFLEVNSEVGRGTVFSIHFPSIDEKQPENIEKDESLVLHGDKTIMVVDDEESIRTSLREILENFNYRVVSFKNGVEAFRAFETDPDIFHLIITDMTMPEMTGDRFARKVLDIRPETPVILCSGYNADISEAYLTDSGIKRYLQKPVDYKKLLHIIGSILNTPDPSK